MLLVGNRAAHYDANRCCALAVPFLLAWGDMYRAALIWIMTAALCLPTIWPMAALGCDCDSHGANPPSPNDACCCSQARKPSPDKKAACPRCAKEPASRNQPNPGDEKLCRCAAPVHREQATPPKEPESWKPEIPVGAAPAANAAGPMPGNSVSGPFASPRLFSVKPPKFAQIVLGVWLT